MAEADFSWMKIASFIGACVFMVLAFLSIAFGINMTAAGNTVYGVATIVGGLACIVLAQWIYQNYQKKSLDNRA